MARVLVATQPWGVLWERNERVPRFPLSGTLAEIDTTVYAAATGSTEIAAAAFITNADGELPGYVEEGSYTLTVNGEEKSVEASSGTGPVLNVKDFGAVGDGTTDDLAAFHAAIDATDPTQPTINLKRGRRIWVPFGTYRLAGNLHIKRQVHLFADSAGGDQYYAGVKLLFDAGFGIICHSSASSPDGGYGDHSLIEGFSIEAAAKTVPDTHGITVYSRTTIRRCDISRFSGDGIRIDADHNNVPATNANSWRVEDTVVHQNDGFGLLANGTDANAGQAVGVNAYNNGKWGFWDSSGLGNYYAGCHSSGQNNVVRSTTLSAAITATQTTIPVVDASLWQTTVLGPVFGEPRGGALLIGTERITFTGISGNTLTGCRRGVEGTGSAPGQGTAATSGTTVSYKGGGYGSGSQGSNNRSVYDGCYSEGQGFSNFVAFPAMILGGTMNQVGTGLYVSAGEINRGLVAPLGPEQAQSDGYIQVGTAARNYRAMDLFRASEGSYTLEHWDASQAGAGRAAWAFVHQSSSQALMLTTTTDGRGGGYAHFPRGLFIGTGNGNHVTFGSAAPTTGTWRRGDIVLGTNPIFEHRVGWVCTTAGTPGTWKPFGPVDQVSVQAISAAATLNLTMDWGSVVSVAGTTTITAITPLIAARELTLIFTSTAQVTDGGTLVLAGNFTGGANRVLKLVCDGTNWYEVSRSTN